MEEKKPKVILIKKVDRPHPIYLKRPSPVEKTEEVKEYDLVRFEMETENTTELQ